MARGNRAAKNENPTDWVTRAADAAIRHAGEGNPVTCASGASPSGPVHLGNLREFLTVHFVADELRRRGVEVRHLHSWDDYDRFRKVPQGVPTEWAEHIGRPLTAVPDPWECHDSWAAHFKAPLQAALTELGVEMVEVSQTEQYRAGTYREQVLRAVRGRHQLDAILEKYRTKKKAAPTAEGEGEEAAESAAEAAGDAPEDFTRFPYKPYCRACGRDTVDITGYDDGTTELSYTCRADGESFVTTLATENEGKLVWKIDWPMRWAHESVNFEPGGADHATPGSSYTVGQEVAPFFDWVAPSFVAYNFVGFAGMQKMSSSTGGVPTASDALEILEPAILRWLYVRRAPKQVFDIDFGPEVVRLYDEWDTLTRKAADPAKRDVAVLAWERASATAVQQLPTAAVTVPFRTLSSVADVTAGSAALISQVINQVGFPHGDVTELEPRLTKAMNWTTGYVPVEERTIVRATPDTERLASLSEAEQEWVRLLIEGLTELSGPEALTQDAATTLIYGVPKIAAGLPVEEKPTEAVKADQKQFFTLLYNLLVGADTGPRLPTLVVALGADTVLSLLR